MTAGSGLHGLLARSARAYPDRPAVVGPDGALRYDELDRQADALAHRLHGLGVRRGDRVVLWSAKCPTLVAAMQAVLRLGAAYVPADGTSPAARVAGLAHDCAARLVLAPADRLPALAAALDDGTACADLHEPVAPAPRAWAEPVTGDDLAYVLYTSGSTGAPKGVSISHRNALAFVGWAAAELAPGPADRFSNHASFTFDLSVLDLYVALGAGAAVHLVPAELAYAPAQLVDFLVGSGITVWYSVPSALTLMMRDGGLLERPAPAALRAVLFAGEPFPIGRVRELAAWTRARLLNLYGPTETNVCTFHEVTPADLERDVPVPIGRPASGDRCWARRADGGTAGPGEEGELLVDGPTVMLGYWGRDPQRGPYPTGDFVRVRPDGSYDYLGRRDAMVKVRGHRIELGEVEAVLVRHTEVAEAAAVAVGEGMDARLVTYVVPAPGRDPGPLALRRHAAQWLPRYMVADEVHVVDRLPRTANGKVDRRALAARATDRPA